MGVTKTDFMRGMQCRKMLWLDKHKPQFKIIPPEVQQALDCGNEFGDQAMGMFGEFVETTCFKPDGRLDYTQMIKNTKEYLENGEPVICEAAFSFYGNYCAVDILRKVNGGYEMYEVKNSSAVTEQHLKDVGFQRYIALKCGVKITKCFVVLPSDGEEKYSITDVSAAAWQYSRWVNDNIWDLGKIKFQKEEIYVDMGEQCQLPYECWYCDYCRALAQSDDSPQKP